MLKVKDLHAEINGKEILRGINLEVRPGEVHAIMGPNGSGKSTFLRCLNLLEEPTGGTITFDGTVITDPRTNIDQVRRQMGMVFQHFNLFNNMTIRKNITLAPVRTGLMKQAEADDAATALLRRVGLEDKADAYPAQLSGGQKQRIAIARACIKNAPIVILDVATSALDNKSEAIVQQAIENLMADRTVFIIAHRLSTVRNADKIVVVNYGKIAEIGTHDELINKENGIYAALYQTQLH